MMRRIGGWFDKIVADGSFADAFEPVSYDDFARNARTGDILLAASKELSAVPTRMFSSQPWTHVGLVCRVRLGGSDNITIAEFSGHNPSEEIYMLNADIADTRRVPGDGVGLYDLDDFFENNGGIYWRPLDLPSEDGRTRIARVIRSMLDANHQKFCNIPNIVMANVFGIRFGDGGVVCSTVVAIALHSSGILPLKKEVSKYLPCDFADDGVPSAKGPYYIVGYRSSRVFRKSLNI